MDLHRYFFLEGTLAFGEEGTCCLVSYEDKLILDTIFGIFMLIFVGPC